MKRFTSIVAVLALLAVGCGDDDATPADAGADGAADAGATPVMIPGLTAPVEAIQDDRGMWHIYGATRDDVIRVEGYLMARDRYGQMEFFRRGTTGRLAELAGSLTDTLIDRDIDARFRGHARNAQILLDSFSPDDLALIQSFADGVNVYIQQLRDGTETLPRGVRDLFVDVVMADPAAIEDWTPLDTMAIARFQAAALSFDLGDDINMTTAFEAWPTAFPSTSTDPRLAARADAFHDLFPFRPVHDVYTRDGFPNEGMDTGSRALRPPRGAAAARAYEPPSREVLRGAWRFAERTEAAYADWFGDDTRGSNSWVVSGSQTMSGNPILSNDPHLGLESPPLFWMAHLNTTRAGGDLDVQGLCISGTPVIILGYNQNIAWGLTTHGFDVTDLYRETITPSLDPSAPDTVEFNGMQVAIQTVTETIRIDDGTERVVEFELVPHHGLIIPETRTPTEAISLRWTGNEVTREVFAFMELATASSVDEARDAYENFGVGGQNLVVVDSAGDIFWTTQVHLPLRDPRAITYDPATRMGIAPSFVLPGTGEYEWTGMLSDQFLPHDMNPANGYIATANNDGVGTISDGNPFNDSHYIGWAFAEGHRIARIRERLDALTARGDITVEDMQTLQGDSLSPIGRLTRDALVAELTRAEEELAASGTHADLTATVADLGPETIGRLVMARDRLEAWSFETPPATEGTPSAEELADSVATSIFNTGIGRVHRALIDDEIEVLYGLMGGPGADSQTFIWALTAPDTLETYDATLGDTVLWDDLSTDTVAETRGEIVVRAFADALAWLEMEHGADMDEWQWGKLHRLRFSSGIPQIGVDHLSIPTPADPTFPMGWGRHGDRGVVDASNFSSRAIDQFTYSGGPVQRLVVEMTPEGPRAFNALPGGQSQNPDDPHHADEAEHWRNNQAPPMYFTEADVEAHAETRLTFNP